MMRDRILVRCHSLFTEYARKGIVSEWLFTASIAIAASAAACSGSSNAGASGTGPALELHLFVGPSGTAAASRIEDCRTLFRPKVGTA